MTKNINIAYVLLGKSVGGAEKRISNLYNYFMNNNDVSEFNFYLIISNEIYSVINKIIPNLNHKNLIIKPSIDKPLTINNTNLIKIINPKPNKKRFKNLRKFVNELVEWKRLISDAKYLNKIYKEYKIDIAHTVWQGSFATAFLRLFFNKPIHILNYMDINHSAVSLRLINTPNSYYLSLKSCEMIDFLGENYHLSLVNLFNRLNIKDYRIAPNSFTSNTFLKPDSINKHNIVVFASRLECHKNPLLFIEVCRIINKKRKDIKFVLCGKGPLEELVIHKINEYKLADAIEFQFCYDIIGIFKTSKIFLSLQERDNYPSQSLLEAMYCGNVVIASNVGDTNKIVNDNNGFLVSLNPYEISDKIQYLIDNPVVFEKLSKNSYNFVKDKHNIENYTKYLAKMYNYFEGRLNY